MENGKDVKELIVAFLKLSTLLAESFKDGVQVADAGVLLLKLQEPQLQNALKAAYQDVEKVKSELSDLTLSEVLEIVVVALPEVKALIHAVAKKA